MQAINTPDFINYLNLLPSKTKLDLECPECSSSFTRTKNVIQSKFGPSNSQNYIFCSYKCAMKSKTKLQTVNCLWCNCSFLKRLDQTIKFPNHFCSRSCAAKYNNTHKTKGNRRSKLEIWLEEQLSNQYPDLTTICNGKDAINSELDFYFPELELAIELNGIFHYEPIYGTDKLSSIQNNDTRKFQACLDKNIELIIIDTSSQKYFKPNSSQKFFDIISKIINLKLEQRKGVEPLT